MKPKYNFLMQIVASIFGVIQPKIYLELRQQSLWSKMLASLVIAFCSLSITMFLGTYLFITDDFFEELFDGKPEISYRDGVLEVDKPLVLNDDSTLFVIETDVDFFNYGNTKIRYARAVNAMDIVEEFQKEQYVFQQALLVSKRNVVLVNRAGNQIFGWKFSDLSSKYGIPDFDGKTLAEDIRPFVFKLIPKIALILLPFRWVWLFFVPLFYAIIGLIVASISKSRMGYTDVYWVSFYINFVFVILKAVVDVLISWSGLGMGLAWYVWVILYLILMVRVSIKASSMRPVSVNRSCSGGAYNPYYNNTQPMNSMPPMNAAPNVNHGQPMSPVQPTNPVQSMNPVPNVNPAQPMNPVPDASTAPSYDSTGERFYRSQRSLDQQNNTDHNL